MRTVCRRFNLIEELGQIKYVFSDKTGTLTQNIMVFKNIILKNGTVVSYDSDTSKLKQESKDSYEKMLLWICVCHSIMIDENNEYQASSPDELALLNYAKTKGYIFKNRTPNKIFVQVPDKVLSFDILSNFEFDSARQRMTVILRENFDRNRTLAISKGSDTVIPSKDPKIELILSKLAKTGLRILSFGEREITDPYELDMIKQTDTSVRKSIECRISKVNERELLMRQIENKSFDFIGATAIEDKLQDQASDTLKTLHKADIKIWVLTGDKVETAESISRSCELIAEKDFCFTGLDLEKNLHVMLLANKI